MGRIKCPRLWFVVLSIFQSMSSSLQTSYWPSQWLVLFISSLDPWCSHLEWGILLKILWHHKLPLTSEGPSYPRYPLPKCLQDIPQYSCISKSPHAKWNQSCTSKFSLEQWHWMWLTNIHPICQLLFEMLITLFMSCYGSISWVGLYHLQIQSPWRLCWPQV